MTKSKLIERLINQLPYIQAKLIDEAVKEIIDHIIITLTNGDRIEIRGFGSFSLHYHMPRIGRNPKTGNKINLKGKYVTYFKPGKELRNFVNIYT
ncbi:MAG: integration host factor subunit beta [Arsenophonus endosymbiont of Ceratovacuna japonica]